MADDTAAVRAQVARQVAHWRAAVIALDDLENFASPDAWSRLERYLGQSLRANLRGAVERLSREGDVLAAELRAAETADELELVRRHVVRFRRRFLRVETGLEFYGGAVNDRSSPKLGALLAACDILAGRALEPVLTPLGKPIPPVLTYIDKGLGASILRAGLRLWDGRTLSVAAAIKLTRHNLNGRPTALLHEAGHQMAFMLDWNDELARALRRELRDDPELAEAWGGWSSEIAGDCMGFVHAGYAAVAALHDVIAGEAGSVYALQAVRPSSDRPLKGACSAGAWRRGIFGEGPWTGLSRAWLVAHPVAGAPPDVRPLDRAVDPAAAAHRRGLPGRADAGVRRSAADRPRRPDASPTRRPCRTYPRRRRLARDVIALALEREPPAARALWLPPGDGARAGARDRRRIRSLDAAPWRRRPVGRCLGGWTMDDQARAGAVKHSAGGQSAASKSNPTSGAGQSTASQSAATGSPPSTTQTGGQAQHDHHHDGDCLRICGSRPLPEADATLELRHKRLEAALHGPLGQVGRRKLNWNGSNQVTVTFDSIEKLLEKAFPPDRPESDIPEQSVGTKQAGS